MCFRIFPEKDGKWLAYCRKAVYTSLEGQRGLCSTGGLMMAKKESKTISIGHKIDRELWEKFQQLADSLVPRVTYTALLEAALIEYIKRHGPKEEKK
jgi:hypothetical protein